MVTSFDITLRRRFGSNLRLQTLCVHGSNQGVISCNGYFSTRARVDSVDLASTALSTLSAFQINPAKTPVMVETKLNGGQERKRDGFKSPRPSPFPKRNAEYPKTPRKPMNRNGQPFFHQTGLPIRSALRQPRCAVANAVCVCVYLRNKREQCQC